MEKHLNKKLDDITNKMMKDVDVEKPSIDFSASLMQKIHELDAKKTASYKPLISKPVWACIAIAFVAVLYFIVSNSDSANSGWLHTLDFSVITNNEITNGLSTITLPKTFVYAIGLLGIMLCVQIPFLKHHFDKRFLV